MIGKLLAKIRKEELAELYAGGFELIVGVQQEWRDGSLPRGIFNQARRPEESDIAREDLVEEDGNRGLVRRTGGEQREAVTGGKGEPLGISTELCRAFWLGKYAGEKL